MPPERGTERRNPLKVPLLAMLTRISMCLKYTCIPPTPQKYAPKYFHAKIPKRRVCHCKILDLMMQPPPIDSTASTWFQIWVAALSPIALVSFVFHAAGFFEIEDCRFNPVSQPKS
jgi:hypothetical protein